MSTLILNYDVLSAVSRNASHLANRVDAYANELTLKVANKTGSVAGVDSSYLSDARYFVNQKIAALKRKRDSFGSFSAQVTALATTAKRVDATVSKMLMSSHEKFLSKHEHLRIDGWKAAIYNWLTDLKNACPLFAMIGDALSCLETEIGSLYGSIKHWYYCEGGKEIFEFVAAIGGAILAVALFIITLPASGFFLICAAIGAAIAVVNAMTNVYTSLQAVHAAHSGDPAWARVYSKQDTLSATLRATNFGNGLMNRLSYGFAFAIDAVQTFCAVVGLVYLGVNAIKAIKNYFSAKPPVNLKAIEGFKQSEASPVVLRKNLIESGVKVPEYPFATHHVVAGNAEKASKSRDIMTGFGIDINDAANGTFLPRVKGVSEAAYHPSLHTYVYYDEVNFLLKRATSKQEALYILADIIEQLSVGAFPH